MLASQAGFAKERLPELKGDSFDCGMCYLVSNNPKECLKCGTMYCGGCIDAWTATHNECPLGCPDARSSIRPISGALSKIYRNLDIKCQYPKCAKIVKICELEQHEALCQLPECEFFAQCGNFVKVKEAFQGTCSLLCQMMKQIKQSNGDWKPIYQQLKSLRDAPPQQPMGLEKQPSGSMIGSQNAAPVFKWDKKRMGDGITLTEDGKGVFLKENAYLFRSVLSDTPMHSGVHYWEIHADSRTENELKIGVFCGKDLNCNIAFCDNDLGFAYYGLGQLRHGSNSSGTAYGKKFKKTGILGVCLDMNKGTISFGLDGENWGPAFKSDTLKKGPIVAAVALLHQAGCSLVTGKKVPEIFLK